MAANKHKKILFVEQPTTTIKFEIPATSDWFGEI